MVATPAAVPAPTAAAGACAAPASSYIVFGAVGWMFPLCLCLLSETCILPIADALSFVTCLQRALELLALPPDGTPRLLLDIGCGSGLSGEALTEAGHAWLGLDISAAMLDVAVEREVRLHCYRKKAY
jgi:SAM-dependent methyltransferase